MTFLDVLVLGLVEGITEFLPISSTAHLMLTRRLLGLDATDNFLKTFLVAIQPGAILAVVVLYWRTLLVQWQVLLRISIAFVPTALLGYFLYSRIKDFLEDDALALWGLGLGGIVLILFEMFHREKPEAQADPAKISWRTCVLIGCFQSLAFVPGVSRAAATILGGLALGLQRKTAVEFSFLLAVPTMTAATLYDLWKSPEALSLEQGHLLLAGFVISFVVALAAIKFLLRYIRTHNFVPFGYYRIAVAVLGGTLFFSGISFLSQ